MTNEITLLPCPFCGGEAEWADGEQKQFGNEQVNCSHCMAVTFPGSDKESAARWWNDRSGIPTDENNFKVQLAKEFAEVTGQLLEDPTKN